MIHLTSAQWAGGVTFLAICFLLSVRRPLLRWADARRARRTAFKDNPRGNDHDE